jgi:hypothetical protein
MISAPQLSVAQGPRSVARGRYFRHALVSPFNLIGPGIIAIVAANVGGWMLLLCGLALQLAFLVVLPRFDFFRAQVDEQHARRERNLAAATRTRLMLRIGDDHRRALERLELLVDRIEDRLARGSAPDPLGMRGLVAAWVRLAIVEKAGRDYFAGTSRQSLLNEVELLADLLPNASPRIRRLAERRLAIAHKRIACWERTRRAMESVAHQMATLHGLVELSHESALAPVDIEAASHDVETLLADLGEDGGPLRELVQLAIHDDPVDPEVLALGRAPLRA